MICLFCAGWLGLSYYSNHYSLLTLLPSGFSSSSSKCSLQSSAASSLHYSYTGIFVRKSLYLIYWLFSLSFSPICWLQYIILPLSATLEDDWSLFPIQDFIYSKGNAISLIFCEMIVLAPRFISCIDYFFLPSSSYTV